MKHIAILREPFFSMVLNGQKTIESRWSMNKCAPFNKIKEGDTIYLKRTGESVTAVAKAKEVKQFILTPELVEEIKFKWGKEIGTDKFKDWQTTLNKKYCTLIWLEDVKVIPKMEVKRSNGAGWVVLKD